MLEHLSAIIHKGIEPISEALKETTIKHTNETPLQLSLETIENTSLESLRIQNTLQAIETSAHEQTEIRDYSNSETRGLTHEEKQQIRNETGWSNELIDAIRSMKEYEIYKNANLQEIEINGRKCLVKNDIDWEKKDSMGRSNRERAEAGLSPITQEGDAIELHHIGQKNDGPLAELTPNEHRGKENNAILHDTKKESEIDRVAFHNERSTHWKSRAHAGEQNA
ncbi:HNH/ENDO VII family nuclease [Thiofilum flexile]|uniref:HNH/ENDO VII family nuclease n=1 Tax=Thiofilum flexile TaxID=125627 RepID=UPI0003791B02|nr:HNH/ENDO VII family nuclease [Thiofilum flexile]